MSFAVTIYGASAPLNHRLGCGDGQAMLMAAPSALRSPQSPSCTQIHSRPLATIPSANGSAKLIHTAPIPAATNSSMTSGASLSVVTKAANSPTPSLGYTGAYAFANVLLTIAGSVILFF